MEGPCPSLQKPTLHSSRKQCPEAQSPQHRAGGAAEGEHEPHSCPRPELPSDTEYCGASGPSVPNSAPLPLPSLSGGDSCCGGEDGCGEKQGERGRSRKPISYPPLFNHLLSSLQSGRRVPWRPAENPGMPNFKFLPFAHPIRKCWILSALPRLETKVRSNAQSHSAVPKIPSNPYFQGSDLQHPGQEASQSTLELTSFSKLKNQKAFI